MVELNKYHQLAARTPRVRAASATGSRTSTTGTFRAPASGAHRSRSGATEDRGELKCIGSVAELDKPRSSRPVEAGFMTENPLKDPRLRGRRQQPRKTTTAFDLHRPYVDRDRPRRRVTGEPMHARAATSSTCGSTSGAMPYAQVATPSRPNSMPRNSLPRARARPNTATTSRYGGTPVPPAFFPAGSQRGRRSDPRLVLHAPRASATMLFDSVAFRHTSSPPASSSTPTATRCRKRVGQRRPTRSR